MQRGGGSWGLGALALACLTLAAEAGEWHGTTTDKAFELVLADAEFAIAEHNFRLTARNDLGAGIRGQRGAPFAAAMVLHFCNLQYAGRLLEADPAHIRAMPCRLFVYTREGRVVVETELVDGRGPRGAQTAAEVNAILKAIVAYAAD